MMIPIDDEACQRAGEKEAAILAQISRSRRDRVEIARENAIEENAEAAAQAVRDAADSDADPDVVDALAEEARAAGGRR